MNDLIKREDVIKALLNLQIFGCINKPAVVGKCVATIMGLPSADRPQGEWIETPDGTMCGNCHKFPYDDGEYHIANWSSDFCPHCGVRMKGAYNGEDIQSTDE